MLACLHSVPIYCYYFEPVSAATCFFHGDKCVFLTMYVYHLLCLLLQVLRAEQKKQKEYENSTFGKLNNLGNTFSKMVGGEGSESEPESDVRTVQKRLLYVFFCPREVKLVPARLNCVNFSPHSNLTSQYFLVHTRKRYFLTTCDHCM